MSIYIYSFDINYVDNQRPWQEGAAMKEKRRSRRFKASLDAEYTKVEDCAVINSLTTTKNISSGGLGVALSRVIKIERR